MEEHTDGGWGSVLQRTNSNGEQRTAGGSSAGQQDTVVMTKMRLAMVAGEEDHLPLAATAADPAKASTAV